MTVLASRILRPATALLAVLLGVTAASGQKAPPPPPAVQAPAPAEPPAAKPDNPGLINELGKLLGKPADLFPSLKLSPNPETPAAPPDEATTATPAPAAPAPPAAPVVAPTPAPPVIATPAPLPAPEPASPPPATARIPQMVTGRSSCPFAANGAPDCKAGADLLCKTKGFTSGRSLDMDSSHNCSKEALLAGARTLKDICRTENFVTRAMCQ